MTRVTDRYLEERRLEILEAAKRVFIRRGYDSATMQDIATEADVAAGSIYRYFPGKAELIAAVSEQCCDDDRELFVPLDEAHPSPLQALLETGERVREQLSTSREREQCILRLESFLAATRDPDLLGPVTHTIEDTEQRLADMFRAAQEAGEFDPSIDPADLARTVHAFTAGIGTLHVALGDAYPVERIWDVMVRLFSSLFLVDPSGGGEPPAASTS